jgi:hypothetical protein
VKNISSSKSSTVNLSVISKNKPVTKIVGIIFMGLSFAVTVMPSAMAETFSIDGMALNTNNNFPLKDGHPIMSTWKFNFNDNDQQFDRQGQQLRHRSTGKCLNAYQAAVGSIVNVYPCNSNDGDQKFDIVSPAGTSAILIRRAGTNLCLDMDSRNPNTRMKLWTCMLDNPNQRFTSTYSQPQPVETSVYSSNNSSSIPSNTIIAKGSSLKSNNQCFRLDAQNDGNLVLYRQSNGQALWATGTDRRNVNRTIFQNDGNLVIYDTSNQAVWASGSDRRGGNRLVVQDDANVVMYTPQGQSVWDTKTSGIPCRVAPQPTKPPAQRESERKVNAFANEWIGKIGITRFERPDLTGQCVTLIARYLQDHYRASKTQDLGLGDGGVTAATVAIKYDDKFINDTNPPIPGSIISFPSMGIRYSNGTRSGHVALVRNVQRNGNALTLTIIESNMDSPRITSQSKVQENAITLNLTNYAVSGSGHFGSAQWVNPKD